MKIAHVVATFPPHVGGMGRVAYDEACGLARRGHDVTVFTLAYRGVSYPTENLPFRVVRLWPFFQLGDAGFVPQLLWRLRKFDVIHFHYPWYGAGDMVWWASFFNRAPYVVTYHMTASPSGLVKRAVKELYDLVWPHLIFRRAKRIFIVDEKQRSEPSFIRRAARKTLLLPNGVDTGLFKPLAQKKIAGERILFVGNLLPVKRLDLLLHALVALPETTLMVIGGGYAENKYREEAKKLGVNERVEWDGICLDRDTLAKQYCAADVVVVPSDAESFSLVVVEALSSGVPVIVSDFPGITGRVENGKTGFVFAAGKIDDLIEKLKMFFALDQEERQRMSEAARAKALEYSLEKHIDVLEKAYGV